jgi:hypothetical protein
MARAPSKPQPTPQPTPSKEAAADAEPVNDFRVVFPVKAGGIVHPIGAVIALPQAVADRLAGFVEKA